MTLLFFHEDEASMTHVLLVRRIYCAEGRGATGSGGLGNRYQFRPTAHHGSGNATPPLSGSVGGMQRECLEELCRWSCTHVFISFGSYESCVVDYLANRELSERLRWHETAVIHVKIATCNNFHARELS